MNDILASMEREKADAAEGAGMMTIRDLEQRAGITDREAFWRAFAHIKGTVRINGIDCDASLQAGIDQLRWIIEHKPLAKSARNDYKGRIPHDDGTVTFYASGVRGDEVRADGAGGTLARGFYLITLDARRLGPFASRPKARKANEGKR